MSEATDVDPGRKWDWALWAGLVLFWAAAAVLVLRGTFVQDSDSVTPILQADEILRGNWALSGWTGAPDNFYTLDIALSVVCVSLWGCGPVVLLVQSLINYGCLMAGAMRLSKAPGCAWWIGGGVLFLFLGVLTKMTKYWFVVIGGHVTTLAICLFCFSLAAALFDGSGKKRQWAAWLGYGVLSFMALAGDPFYKYIGLLPIVMAGLLVAARCGRWRQLVKLVVVSGLALVAAKLFVLLLQAQGFHIVDFDPFWKYLAGFDTIKNNLYKYVMGWWILLGAGDRDSLGAGGSIVTVLAGALLGLRLFAAVLAMGWTGKWLLAGKSADQPGELFINGVLLAGIGLDSAAYIFSTMPGEGVAISTCRYLIPAVVYASILVVRRGGPGMSARWRAAGPWGRRAVPAVFFAALAWLIPGIVELSRGQPNATEIQLADFLQAKGLRSGFGGYWQSSIITVLSEKKVKVSGLQMGAYGRVSPFHWLSKDSWYDAPANFFVYNPNELEPNLEAQALSTFGPPVETANVGPYHVFIWDHDIHGQLDRPELDLDRPDLVKFPLDLLKLRRQFSTMGVRVNGDGSMVDEQKYAEAKCIVFGPYIHLPAGRYRVTFVLSATDAGDGDLVAADGTIRYGRQLLDRREIAGRAMKNGPATFSLQLNFDYPGPQEISEFRLWKTGGMKLTLRGLTVEKI